MMGQSDELLLLSLSPNEMRTLLALRHLADLNDKAKVTMEELGLLTGYSRESLRLAMRGLEERNLVATNRTKRNLGKLYKNEYQLLPENWENPEILASTEPENTPNRELKLPEKLASTASTAILVNTDNEDTKVNKDFVFIYAAKPHKEEKMVNRWDDDDDIGGFGLLEGEVPGSQKKGPVARNNPRSRHQRPEDQWTTNDVASELASKLYENVRGVPGLINVRKLGPILGKYRKDYGTNALIELEVVEMMMGDPVMLAKVKRDPANAWRMYLGLLTTRGKQAQDNLGMDEETAVPTSGFDNSTNSSYVYASDGKRFDNSMPGRNALKRYEEKIGKTV
jgi:hypothetical protein